MKKIKKIIKKIFLFTVVVFEVALLVAYPVQASLFGNTSGPSFNANKAASQLEERYHIDKDTAKSFGETFNVSSQKEPAAEVDIFFSPTNPKFGEKVTATAIPKYFQEGSENMYFTWYIKHEGCDIGSSKESCDVDDDGDVDVNDWKVEAMRFASNGGFVKEKADYSSDTDDDGYSAHKGGGVNVQETDYCYLHDFESGENYEMGTGDTDGDEDSGCAGGEVLCVVDQELSCGVTNETTTVPQYDMGSGSSNTTGDDSSTSVDLETPEHEETTLGTNKSYTDIYSDSDYDATCDADTSLMTCPEDTTALCVGNEDLDLIDPTCDQIIICPEEPEEGTDCYKLKNKDIGTANPSCTTDVITEDEVELKCEHQFPKISGMEVGDGDFGGEEEKFWGTDPKDPSTMDNENNDEANVAGLGIDAVTWTYVPGDEIGVIVEGQSYLPTKHDDSSTAISFALVKNIFSKEGDDNCSLEKGTYQKTIKDFTVEIPFANVSIDDCLQYNLTSPTSGDQADNMEITMDYYPENPNVGSMGTDGAGQSNGGDELIVSTTTSDPNIDINQIYYKWSIYGFSGNREDLSLEQDDWTLLSDNESFRSTNNIQLLEGLGMDQFKLQLNTAEVEGVKYNFFRFFVESEEFYDTGTGTTGTTRSGRGDILVEPNYSGAGGINIMVGTSTPICETDDVCEVLENQVITATMDMEASTSGVDNYLWTLDGKTINTLEEGETKQGNSVTFLLEGRPGDSHVLSVIANDTASPEEALTDESKNKGEKLTVERNFIVTTPMVGIGPNNSINRGSEEVTECKDLNGNLDSSAVMGIYSTIADTASGEESQEVVDCKESVFNGSGSVTISPTYYPDWIKDGLKNVKYSVNGTEVEGCSSASCEIDLSAYAEGSMVGISFEAEYWQSDEQRLALKEWGIMEVDSGGKKISDSITAKVGESIEPTAAKKASKIIAGLAYNIPEQMIFMFRLILTAATIIFAAGIIMSFGQKNIANS